jgi:hypothetical protein
MNPLLLALLLPFRVVVRPIFLVMGRVLIHQILINANSYQRELYWNYGISNANFTVGIGGLVVKTTLGAYQLVFDTPIPKVVGEKFTYYHNFIWDRKTTWV